MEADQYKKLHKRVKKYFADATLGNEDLRKRGKRVLGFIIGGEGQWKPEDIEKLSSEVRPAITINYTRRYLEFLMGVFQSNRKDIIIHPRVSSKKALSDAFTDQVKHVYDQNDAIYEEDKQFQDGCSIEKGWMRIWTEDDLISGNRQVKMGRVCTFDVFQDNLSTEYDFDEDGKHLTWIRWVDKEWLEARYPNRASEIKSAKQDAEYETGTSPMEVASAIGQYQYDDDARALSSVSTSKLQDYKYCLRYTYYKEFKRGVEVYDTTQNRSAKLIDEKKITSAETLASLHPDVIKVSKRKNIEFLRLVIWLPGLVLEYDDDPWDCDNQITLFPFVHYSANFYDGVAQGVLDDVVGHGRVIGPQALLNKSASQFLDHLNRSVNSPAYFDNKTFFNTEEEDRFVKKGSQPGQRYKLKDLNNTPVIGAPAQFNRAYLELFSLAVETLKETTVNDPSIGFSSKDDLSGVAIEKLQNQAVMTKSIPFTNYEHTKRMIARLIMELLIKCQIYSIEELEDILGPDIYKDPELLKLAERELGPPPESPEIAMQADMQQAMAIDPERAQMMLPQIMSGPEHQNAMRQYEAKMNQYQYQLKQTQLKILYKTMQSARVMEYWIKVSEGQHTVSRQMHNLLAMRTFSEIYPGVIPPDVAIKLIDLPYKEEIIDYIKSMQQQQQAQVQNAG